MNDATYEVRRGDCLEVLGEIPDASVDAVVTDPPYGIGFMGHEWDQPGDFGPVRSNGTPGEFAGGRPQEGPHLAGGAAALERQMARSARRGTQRSPAVGAGHQRERDAARLADGERDHTKTRERAGAMHAGRYDLSPSANQRFQLWCAAWLTECLRVLKPGGFLLSFGGSRTFHRLVVAAEDVGFEIRDRVVTITGHELGPEIQWLYGSGFPKSLNVSKAIDRAAGAEREVLGPPAGIGNRDPANHADHADYPGLSGRWSVMETGAATEEAKTWEGWGTALKPAHEPICVARKPLSEGTVAAQVLATGTGALNIGATRIGNGEDKLPGGRGLFDGKACETDNSVGRWPGNVALIHGPGCAEECAPGCPIAELDEQSGTLTSGANPTSRGSDKFRGVYGDFVGQEECEPARGADSGGASRFMYCAKSAAAERDAGLQGFRAQEVFADVMPNNPRCLACGNDRIARQPDEPSCTCDAPEWAPSGDTGRANFHPTVKPIELMRWLVRLVAPPGATILDPFAGSGTTLCAAVLEGVNVIGIERSDEYATIAEARAKFWAEVPEGVTLERAIVGDLQRRRTAETGQVSLFAEGA